MPLNLEDHLDEIIEILKLHLLPLMLIFVTLICKKQVKQTNYESFTFYWLLFTGSMFQITWKGFIGVLRQCEPMLRALSLLDQRFKKQTNTFRCLCLSEFLILGPLCLYTANLFLKQRGLKRDVMLVLISFLHIVVTSIDMYDEYLNNFENVCQESCFSFTNENILQFWLGFVFFQPFWIFVPIIHIYKGLNNILAQERWTQEKCLIENGYTGNYYDYYNQDYQQGEKRKNKKKNE